MLQYIIHFCVPAPAPGPGRQVLSTYLETLYGFWRLLPVWLAAGLAGNFASAVLEAPCTLVVGASG